MINILEGLDTKFLTDSNWSSLTVVEKIELLSRVESNISKIQHRESKKIVHLPQKGITKALYDFKTDQIIIYNLEEPFDSLGIIIHEGIHAMVHDATIGKTKKIYLNTPITGEELRRIIQLRDIIYNYFFNISTFYLKNDLKSSAYTWHALFAVRYYEEQLAKYESYFYLYQTATIHNNESLKNYSLINMINYCKYVEKLELTIGRYEDILEKIPFDEFKNKYISVKKFEVKSVKSKIRSKKEKEIYGKTEQTFNAIIKKHSITQIKPCPYELLFIKN